MKQYSTTNTFQSSDGTRYTQAQINARVRKAKAEFLQEFASKHGYHYCEECQLNYLHCRLSVSHTISEKEAKENGRVELCWDKENFRLLCLQCHGEHDGLNTQLKFI